MARAFIAEVKTDQGTVYIGKSSMLSKIPYVFSSAGMLKRRLSQHRRGYSSYWSRASYLDQTTIISIDQLQNGLKNSVAKPMSVLEFEALNFSSSAKRNPNAIYKIRLGHEKFVGQYPTSSPRGRIWTNVGQLRSVISANLRACIAGSWVNAEVVEIVFKADGVTQDAVNFYPILQFYEQSPSSRKYFAKWMMANEGPVFSTVAIQNNAVDGMEFK